MAKDELSITGRSSSMLPVKRGTMIATLVNCSGRSVSAHRWVSPKRSFRRSASASE